MLKVVVVEDEELVRKGIVLTVDWAGAGCAVVGEAANGEEGLEVIRRYRPDLIVTDIRMPKLDGIEMLRRLREEGNRAHVVFLTAYSDFSYAQIGAEAGALRTTCSSPFTTGSWRRPSPASAAAPRPQPGGFRRPGPAGGAGAGKEQIRPGGAGLSFRALQRPGYQRLVRGPQSGRQRRASEPCFQEGDVLHALGPISPTTGCTRPRSFCGTAA